MFRYSTISDFHKCHKYYELKHILKQPDGSDKAGELRFGSAIHMGIQELFLEGDGIDVFNTFWDMYKDANLEYSYYNRMDHAQHRKLGQVLLEIFRDEHMAKFSVSRDEQGPILERKMTGSIGGRTFGGTLDWLGTFQKTKTTTPVLSLVDWKTSAAPYDNYKLRHNEQIYGYVALAEQSLGIRPVQGVYAVAVKDVKNPRWQFKTALVTKQKLDHILDNIAQVCNDISSAKQFYKNPTACVIGKRVCPYFEHCHGGQASDDEETA